MAAEIPAEFLDGITEVVVSPRAVPHPVHAEVFTLGECIPLPVEAEGGDGVRSRVVLYHGSFRALAALDEGFDWEAEAWETLLHELRHHVEWRASRDDLGSRDGASEANFARLAGEPFDPLFFLDGDDVGAGTYRVDHDWFIDRPVRRRPDAVSFTWRGRGYRVGLPAGATLPAYLAVEGVIDPPEGEMIVVVRRSPRLTDLFRRGRPPFEATVAAVPRPAEEERPADGL
jgi:hypothetical protein